MVSRALEPHRLATLLGARTSSREMSDSDDLTLTLTPPPAATYYAGAPFYTATVRAAQPNENRPRHWPNISLESLYVDLGVVPPRALVDVRYPPNPPRVDGGFSPPTNEERLRRAMTAEELAAPLVTPAGTPVVGRTLTFGVVCEVYVPGDSSVGFDGYMGVTANEGRVRLREGYHVQDSAYGSSTHEVWEKVTDGHDENSLVWTAGDAIELMLIRFRERHPERKRCWGGGGRVGIWDELIGGDKEPRCVTLMRHIGCYLLVACE